MKMVSLAVIGILVGCGYVYGAQKSVSMMLEEAQYQEETVGDVNVAMSLYEKIIEDEAARRPEVAKAMYRYGVCLAKKGQSDKAAEIFKDVIAKYEDQKIFAMKAERELEKIGGNGTGGGTIFTDSCETGEDVPSGWEKGADITGVEYIWDRQAGSDGKSSLSIKKTADKYFPIAEWRRTEKYDGKSKKIEVSAMVKAQDAGKAVIDVLFLDSKGGWIKHQWISYIGAKRAGDKPVTHDCKKYSGEAEIPSNTETVVVGLQMYGPGQVWFDEVKARYVGVGGEAIYAKALLHNKVTVSADKSPDGDRLTVQYAVMAVCDELKVPYQFEKSQQLGGEKVRQYIDPIKFVDTPADKSLESILKPLGLGWETNENGLYIRMASRSDNNGKLRAEVLTAEGWKLWQERKLGPAEIAFKEAIEADPNAEGAYQGLGWAQLNQGKKLNARNSFEKCVGINPKNPAALNGLGWIAKGKGDDANAVTWWEKAVAAQPGATAALAGLAQVYSEKGDNQKAALYYREILKYEPDNSDAKAGLAKVSDKGGANDNQTKIQSLIKELDDASAPPFEALNKLVEIGEPAVEPLIETMKTSNNWQIAKALGAIKDTRAVGPLIEKWGNADFEPMNAVIAEALENITVQKFGRDLGKWKEWYRNSMAG